MELLLNLIIEIPNPEICLKALYKSHEYWIVKLCTLLIENQDSYIQQNCASNVKTNFEELTNNKMYKTNCKVVRLIKDALDELWPDFFKSHFDNHSYIMKLNDEIKFNTSERESNSDCLSETNINFKYSQLFEIVMKRWFSERWDV